MANLNNNQDLISLFKTLFQHNKLTPVAPNIMKFFIITRNFGLLNYKENIVKLMNRANPDDLALQVIKEGFEEKNIEFTIENLVSLLVTNYHDNGFYFHSFPSVYKESIMENGILASRRTPMDEKYYAIASKYHFGEYFTNPNNRVCVTEKIGVPFTNEYSILTPEWLYEFLKQGNGDITEAFANGDLTELDSIVQNALNSIKTGMERNPQYDENDFIFLSQYIKDVVEKRFAKGNNEVDIALIEKANSDEYFEKHYQKKDIESLVNNMRIYGLPPKEVFYFIIERLSQGIKTTDKSIPKDLLNIVSYQLKSGTIEKNRAIK